MEYCFTDSEKKSVYKFVKKEKNNLDKTSFPYSFSRDRKYFKRRFMLTEEELTESHLPPLYNECISFFIKDDINRNLYEQYIKDYIYNFRTCGEIEEYLSELSNIIKRGQHIEYWERLVDINTLGGILYEISNDEFEKRIKEWTQGYSMHKVFNDESLFYNLFEKAVENLEYSLPIRQTRRFISFREYLDRTYLWGLSGSTTLKSNVTHVETNNQEMKIRQTKWSVALFMDKDELYKTILSKRFVPIIALQKPGAAKIRLAMSSGFEFYLLLDYVDYFFQDTLRQWEYSTFWFKKKKRFSFWMDFAKKTVTKERFHIPLDQSKFDWNISTRMILSIVKMIRRIGPKIGIQFDENEKIFNILEHLFSHNKVQIGEEVLDVMKGVMSGWKWTALMDTFVNYCQMQVAISILDYFTLELPEDITLQGDDDRLSLQSPISIYIIIRIYDMMGFIIHPKKFFVKQGCDEFLRKIALNGRVFGPCARTISTILEPKPENRDKVDRLEMVTEVLSTFYTYMSRIKDTIEFNLYKHYIIREIEYLIPGISKIVWKPKCVGGMGFQPYDNNENAYVIEKENIKIGEVNDMHIPGLEYENKQIMERYGISVYDGKKLYDILRPGELTYANHIKYTIVEREMRSAKKYEDIELLSCEEILLKNRQNPYRIKYRNEEEKLYFNNAKLIKTLYKENRLNEIIINSEEIESRMSQKVIYDIMQGELKIKRPTNYNIDPFMYGYISEKYENYFLQKYYYKNVDKKLTNEVLNRISGILEMNLEEKIKEYFSDNEVDFGY
jgi:hypothetical protein